MSTTSVLALSPSISDLSSYARAIETYPKLTAEDELDLASRFLEKNDLDAAKLLILSNLRGVFSIVRGYAGYGLPMEDVVQEGNIGLMEAIKRFDPSKGARVMTYAAHGIRSRIHEYILKNWRIVKVITTKAKRKLFYKLRSSKPRLEWLTQAEAQRIAESFDVSIADVLEMDAQMYIRDQSFDTSAAFSDEDNWTPEVYLQHDGPSPEEQVSDKQSSEFESNVLAKALKILDDRSKDIIHSRWLLIDDAKPTLQELGDRYNVSAERIRQIESAALERLHKTMNADLREDDAHSSGDHKLLVA